MANPVQIFYIVADEDDRYRARLEKHLQILENEQRIQTWWAKKVIAGDTLAQEIDKRLFEADLILLLLSADFMACYLQSHEMQTALERHRKDEARVVPIVLRAIDLSIGPLAGIQTLPKTIGPVSSWSDEDDAWVSIEKEIKALLDDLPHWQRRDRQPPVKTTPPTPTGQFMLSASDLSAEPEEQQQSKEDRALVWLHLSDFHAGAPGKPLISEALCEDMKRMMDQLGQAPDMLILSGDLAYSGKAEEYEQVDQYLDLILNKVVKPAGAGEDPVLVAVPGNHDLTRPSRYNPAALSFDRYDDPCARAVRERDESAMEYLGQLFAEFQRWWARRVHPSWDRGCLSYRKGLLPGDFMLTMERCGLKLGVAGLNTAFLQQRARDYRGKLAVEEEQLHKDDLARWAERRDLALLVMHHPPTWLNEQSRKIFDEAIYPPERFAACLFGHLHQNYLTGELTQEGRRQRWFQAGALFGHLPFAGQDGKEERRESGCAWGRITRTSQQQVQLEYYPRRLRLSDEPHVFEPATTPYPRRAEVALRCDKQLKPVGRRYRRPRLAHPTPRPGDEYDVVVIGSGYGGAVVAARLAAAAGKSKSICVLERGKEWRGGELRENELVGGDFPAKLADLPNAIRTHDNPLGLFEYYFNKDIDVLVGNGLGGTSLINAGVMMAPDLRLFRSAPWPPGLPDLTPYFERARLILQVGCYPQGRPLPSRSQEFLKAVSRLNGHPSVTPEDLAITFSEKEQEETGLYQRACVGCGSCITGCNYSAKNSLDLNYLALAKKHGAEIFTGIEVESIEQKGEGEDQDRVYQIYYWDPLATGTAKRIPIRARQVVLAAGVFGTFSILKRSELGQGRPVSAKLGSHFHGNGDILGFAYDCSKLPQPQKSTGPTSTTLARYHSRLNQKHSFVISEMGIPAALKDLLCSLIPLVRPSEDDVDTLTSEHLKEWMQMKTHLLRTRSSAAVSRSIAMLGMGFEESTGELKYLTPGGKARIQVSWPKAASQTFVGDIEEAMKGIAKELGGTYLKSPRGREFFSSNSITVHPLGGCPMGSSADTGVVNYKTEVFGHERHLYIADGSIIPGSLGVGPALTIAALAEWSAEQIILSWTQTGSPRRPERD